jgi:hypothetical protein
MRAAALLAALLLAVGCSDDSETPDPDTGVVDLQTGDMPWLAEGIWYQDSGQGDLPLQGDGTVQQDIPAGSPTLQDTCPPSGAPITSDITLSGTTSAQNIAVSCSSGGNPYGQAVALHLSQQMKVQVTVTSDASLTILGVWPDCTTWTGCKAGDASSGMTYEVTRDAGTHYILVGTSSPTSFTLAVALVAP